MILTQLYLVVSGNYAWLNWLTIVARRRHRRPGRRAARARSARRRPRPRPRRRPRGLVVVLSWWLVLNMASPAAR
jgi:hypothetical protein